MNVLLAESDLLLGRKIKAMLAREGYRVTWLTEGEQVAQRVRSEPFLLLILDLGLSDVDGLGVLRKVRSHSQLPILIFARGDDVERYILGLNAGADDYMLEPFGSQPLLARIRVLTQRAGGEFAQPLSLGRLSINELGHQVSWDGTPINLGRREFSLLLELARHRDEVMSRLELENQLYNRGEEIGSNALEVHIHHLRRKLDKQLIMTIRGVGYRLDSHAT
ncbi:response regulator transcription factor [Salinicola salarius]|uniref:winged helix-turn-helix domain-containing protein n=1 Tax=Salinicola salarius TaxID=430457 RepID=UPI000DA1F1D6|nr:response regulator transcription factor [Salinicola salarius]